MKLKRNSTAKLHWYTYVGDFNNNKIRTFDIFSHTLLKEDIVKEFKKTDDFKLFQGELKSKLMYSYWSKCEYEIILNQWPPRDDDSGLKVDVYSQVMLNFEVFSKYVWSTLAGDI